MPTNRFTEDDLLAKGYTPDGRGGFVPKSKLIRVIQVPKDKTIPIILNDTSKIVIQWCGKDISLNTWYSSKHWTQRDKQKKEWHKFFKSLIFKPYPVIEKYIITLECNSRIDPSNCITMIKLVEDTMQEMGILKNDSAKFCRGLHIIPVDEMKRKSYKIIVQKV